mmetsp:Transcript_9290/g.27285  ORF Transcript_9290/g.27285 Transcript_9290/m.27285 type:complete len:298 (-) Transcript_9290:351-1244(-)
MEAHAREDVAEHLHDVVEDLREQRPLELEGQAPLGDLLEVENVGGHGAQLLRARRDAGPHRLKQAPVVVAQVQAPHRQRRRMELAEGLHAAEDGLQWVPQLVAQEPRALLDARLGLHRADPIVIVLHEQQELVALQQLVVVEQDEDQQEQRQRVGEGHDARQVLPRQVEVRELRRDVDVAEARNADGHDERQAREAQERRDDEHARRHDAHVRSRDGEQTELVAEAERHVLDGNVADARHLEALQVHQRVHDVQHEQRDGGPPPEHPLARVRGNGLLGVARLVDVEGGLPQLPEEDE